MANTLLNPVTGAAPTTAAQGRSTATTDSATETKDMFLKLMVAQLQNQNPLNPADGTAFLQQLSQISGVEQMIEMRQQLEAIRQDLDANAAGPASAAATGAL